MVVMVMVLHGVRRVVAGAKLEDVRERGYKEQQQFEEQLLGSADAKQEGYHEHKLQLDELDDEQQRHEACQQFILYELL